GVLPLHRLVLPLRDRYHRDVERAGDLHLVYRPFKRAAGGVVAHAEDAGRNANEGHPDGVLDQPDRATDGGTAGSAGGEWPATACGEQRRGGIGRSLRVVALAASRRDRCMNGRTL